MSRLLQADRKAIVTLRKQKSISQHTQCQTLGRLEELLVSFIVLLKHWVALIG